MRVPDATSSARTAATASPRVNMIMSRERIGAALHPASANAAHTRASASSRPPGTVVQTNEPPAFNSYALAGVPLANAGIDAGHPEELPPDAGRSHDQAPKSAVLSSEKTRSGTRVFINRPPLY